MEMTAGSAIQTSAMEGALFLPAFRPDFAPQPTEHLPIQHFNGNFEQSIPLHGQHEGSVLIVIGKVSGSDWQTSAAVSKLIHDIWELADDFSGPGALLAQLNNRINTRVGGPLCGETATCLALFLEPDGNCTVASAGRPLPIVNGREVTLKTGLPLGLPCASEFAERQLSLREYAVAGNVRIQMPRFANC
jgi:hypothetical protein